MDQFPSPYYPVVSPREIIRKVYIYTSFPLIHCVHFHETGILLPWSHLSFVNIVFVCDVGAVDVSFTVSSFALLQIALCDACAIHEQWMFHFVVIHCSISHCVLI